jgi:hypothetical protein
VFLEQRTHCPFLFFVVIGWNLCSGSANEYTPEEKRTRLFFVVVILIKERKTFLKKYKRNIYNLRIWGLFVSPEKIN